MPTSTPKNMANFCVEVELANHEDIILARHGTINPAEVRRIAIEGVVDSGVAHVMLPPFTVKQLGLRIAGKVKVPCGAGRTVKRDQVECVRVGLLGREGVFDAIVEPERQTALIGFMVQQPNRVRSCSNRLEMFS